MHFSRCGVCQDVYQCGCADFKVEGIHCKHFHAAPTRQPNGGEDANVAKMNANPMVQDEEASNGEHFQDLLQINQGNIVQMFDVDNIRAAIIEKIANLTEIVQILTSPLALRTVMSRLNSPITVTHGLEHL